MRLLVTRATDEAEALASRLREMGHQPVLSPLIAVHLNPLPPPQPGAAYIATSKNGVRAIHAAGWPVATLYCPGEGTAALARELGYADIRTGGGDAASLAPVIAARESPQTRPLEYVRATEIAFDMAAALAEAGVKARALTGYTMAAAESLSQEAIDALRNGLLHGVLLLSPRTAQVYAALVARHSLLSAAARVRLYCLSANVAAKAASIGAKAVIAPAPDLDSLLSLLNGE
jgi:uroporphyrinogen-III synthase